MIQKAGLVDARSRLRGAKPGTPKIPVPVTGETAWPPPTIGRTARGRGCFAPQNRWGRAARRNTGAAGCGRYRGRSWSFPDRTAGLSRRLRAPGSSRRGAGRLVRHGIRRRLSGCRREKTEQTDGQKNCAIFPNNANHLHTSVSGLSVIGSHSYRIFFDCRTIPEKVEFPPRF